MFKFGVSNIRRLEHMVPAEIKPITLLLGRNSGGKSTYLRTFPLFRQSLMTRTSSPILWYGDLVDFGSFETAISRQGNQNNISFSYVFDRLGIHDAPVYYGDELGFYRRDVTSFELQDVTYNVSIARRAERTRVSSIEIITATASMRIVAEIDDNNGVAKLTVNEEDILGSISPTKMQITGASLFPEFRFIRPREELKRDAWLVQSQSAIFPDLVKLLRRMIDRRVRDKSINELAIRLLSSGLPDRGKIIAIGKSQGMTIGTVFESLSESPSKTFQQIVNLLYASYIPTVMRAVASQLKSILSATLYIGPARARSERYYRYQDLAVSEIDPDGKNFPMFLNSLSKRQIDAFSEWVSSLFGYGVAVSRQTGHISINLSVGGVQTNIVDVGYGVSQILPVLGQIWWARERPTTREQRSPLALLAIEQPELHLHPAHQALLADALVEEAKASTAQTVGRPRMHYVVETHSETLVNRLGEFIAAKKLAPSDVQVLLFEPDDPDSTTRVRTVQFDETGSLIDWPYGFFQPSVSSI